MSAEELGKKLAAEVDAATEGFDKVLHALQAVREEPTIGIPALDNAIRLQQARRHPRDQRTASPSRQHGTSATIPLPKYPAIEITSTTPCAGKTHLLYHLISLAVLPATYHGRPLEGKSRTIVILDTDARFSVPRLAEIMTQHITRQLAHDPPADDNGEHEETYTPSAADIHTLIRTSLQHVHILRPASYASLLATLQTLPSYLLRASAHRSAHRRLHAVLLDSATAFYWPRRAEAEAARAAALDGAAAAAAAAAGWARDGAGYEELVRELRALALRFGCAVVVTSNAVVPARRRGAFGRADGRGGSWSVLPRSWPGFVTVRVLVGREAVGKFAPALSAEEALARRAERMAVVGRGRFVVVVDGAPAEWEADEVKIGTLSFVFRRL